MIDFDVLYMKADHGSVRSAEVSALDIDSAARRAIEGVREGEFVVAVVQADVPLAVVRTVA